MTSSAAFTWPLSPRFSIKPDKPDPLAGEKLEALLRRFGLPQGYRVDDLNRLLLDIIAEFLRRGLQAPSNGCYDDVTMPMPAVPSLVASPALNGEEHTHELFQLVLALLQDNQFFQKLDLLEVLIGLLRRAVERFPDALTPLQLLTLENEFSVRWFAQRGIRWRIETSRTQYPNLVEIGGDDNWLSQRVTQDTLNQLPPGKLIEALRVFTRSTHERRGYDDRVLAKLLTALSHALSDLPLRGVPRELLAMLRQLEVDWRAVIKEGWIYFSQLYPVIQSFHAILKGALTRLGVTPLGPEARPSWDSDP